MVCFSLQMADARLSGEDENVAIQTTPYLQYSQEGVTLMWQTRVPSDSWIEIGVKPDELLRKEKETDKLSMQEMQFHKIQLTDLVSGTTYYYRICSRELNTDNDSETNELRVTVSELATFTFWAIVPKDTVCL